MRTASEILRAAKAKIAEPSRWVKGAPALNADGSAVDPWRGHAVCWCVNGALVEVTRTGELMQSRASFILSQCARRRGYETASRLNDAPETTHADVMALFDEAIAWAESDA